MATPFLRGLRGLYPGARIAAVARPLVAPVVTGLPYVDEILVFKPGEEGRFGGELGAFGGDLGVLLPNSFRSAWMLWRAGVKRRVGYAREWRSWLLTDRVKPVLRTREQVERDRKKAEAIQEIGRGRVRVEVGSKYQPVPTIEYYLWLLEHLGGAAGDRRMELGITAEERAEAEGALVQIENGKWKMENLIVMVPGANFGASKCWMPERFAAVADRLIEERAATVVLAGSPAELPIVEAIVGASKHRERVVALAKLNGGKGVSLGALKEIVRRSSLMVCNDTGPRHFAVALGVPVVTLFGPTDPVWAETFYERERQVKIEVACGPCQLKKCPIDHRCMKGITPEMVMGAVEGLRGG